MIELIHNLDSFLFSFYSETSHKNSFSLLNHLTSSSKSSENSSSELITFLNFFNQAKILKNSEFQLNAKMIFSSHVSFFLKQAKALNIMMSDAIERVIQTALKNIQSTIQVTIDNV